MAHITTLPVQIPASDDVRLLAAALAALDAAGFEYSIACSGPQPQCPSWSPAVAA